MPAPSVQQTGPLWGGPENRGPNGGITQSQISKWLSCRERFRLAQVEGWRSKGDFEKVIFYGSAWHVCEEMVAGSQDWEGPLRAYAEAEAKKNPLHAEDIDHWYRACKVVFPEYMRFWSTHKDTTSRKSLGEEYIFDLDYTLPKSKRVVRLRGKYDGVELLQKPSGPEVWLFETKTKGSIEQASIEKLLSFDLQTMMYLTSLFLLGQFGQDEFAAKLRHNGKPRPIGGVRYNVIRRPFSGVGSIKRRKATAKQREETKDEYYERLRTDYVAADPKNWFFRWEVPIGPHDIQAFRDTCLDPLLEQICDWYAEVTGRPTKTPPGYKTPLHFRHPYGVRNSIDEGYLTEYDWMLMGNGSGSLVRAESLFNELKAGV